MKANGAAQTTDDCFAAFDEAFARMEAGFESATSASGAARTAPAADFSDYEEAFTQIDRQLGATSLPQPGVGVRGNLALVSSPTATLAEPSLEKSVAPPAVEELWRRANGVGTPLERLVETMQNLLWLQRAIHSRSVRMVDHVKYEEVSAVFSDARQLCVDFDLPTARVRAAFALAALEENRVDSLAVEISELVRHIRHDLQSCSIWPIAQGRMWAFSLSPGERAQRAFPSVASDVAEGGRCAGFGFNSASVFHLLRAAACGSRALETAAGGRRAAAERPSWTSTIGLVEAQLAEVSRWPAGAARTAATTFYTSVLNDARTLHDAECRLASGASFEEPQTLAIIDTSRDFLTRLADYVTESQAQPLGEQDFAAAR